MSTAVPRGARAHVAPSRAAGSASVVPVAVGLSCTALSLVLAVVVALIASAPVVFLGLPLPLVAGGAWGWSLLGYLLTPVAVVACYGWGAMGQRRGLAADVNFADRPMFGTILLWAAALGIVLGAWHVLNLSVPLSEAWGLS